MERFTVPRHTDIKVNSESARQAWNEAWIWLCRQRHHAPVNADIWDLRFHWQRENPRLYRQVLNGEYRLSPLQVFRARRGNVSVAVWSSRDALVLKWTCLMIQGCLPVHEDCVHVAGHHGGRDSLARITQVIRDGAIFVYRTDIRGYYRHIRKAMLYAQVCRSVMDPVLQALIRQFIYYSVEDGGEISVPETGISRGCSLSPFLGATLLRYVDRYFAGDEGVFYVRYMYDFLFLSDRRWPVRRARTRLLEFMDTAGFECHPDKTQCGRISRGFDWLGLWFTDTGASGPAPRAKENHRLRRQRLEEQTLHAGHNREVVAQRVQQYERRWSQWVDGQMAAASPDTRCF
ncbi:transposase [Salmonella enterica]|nr:transposase [Salmonella enterica]ECY4645544.1 transposase [Salmonella enterica subsp. enterica serovar Eastbourne]EDU9493692.1 transposase [Salmonella enterica subsp. enterica]EDV0774422.1 transposase [Salmonella enterica subsp. enterica]EJP6694717.1 transposase [Salmonella enterica]